MTIAENFRQPFFAKNASEFWRRWHITLGTWFKDYIFYPISVAKPIRNLTKKAQKRFGKGFAKFVTPSIALLGVWMANGFWHGPRWTYIFYGVYYYVMILLELLLERPLEIVSEKLHFSIDGIPFRIFRFVKLFFIVIIGEMLFTADTLTEGFRMLHSIFTNFSLRSLWANKSFFGMSGYEYIVVFFAVLVVLIYNTMREFRIPFEEKFAKLPEAVRWCGWLLLLFAVIMFGAYGPGYDAVAMIYAGF